jgi:hypothetical protein
LADHHGGRGEWPLIPFPIGCLLLFRSIAN